LVIVLSVLLLLVIVLSVLLLLVKPSHGGDRNTFVSQGQDLTECLVFGEYILTHKRPFAEAPN
jgi:competence protein ComGC